MIGETLKCNRIMKHTRFGDLTAYKLLIALPRSILYKFLCRKNVFFFNVVFHVEYHNTNEINIFRSYAFPRAKLNNCT